MRDHRCGRGTEDVVDRGGFRLVPCWLLLLIPNNVGDMAYLAYTSQPIIKESQGRE